MEHHIVLCNITRRIITVALHTNGSYGMIYANTEKRHIIIVSENKSGYISGNLKF